MSRSQPLQACRYCPGSAAWMAVLVCAAGDGVVALRAQPVPDEAGDHVEAPALLGGDAIGVGQVVGLQEFDVEHRDPLLRLGGLHGLPRQGEQRRGQQRHAHPPEPGGQGRAHRVTGLGPGVSLVLP